MSFWQQFIIGGCIVFIMTFIFMYLGLRILTYFGKFNGPKEWSRRVKK